MAWKDNHVRGVRLRGWTNGAHTVYVAGVEERLNRYERENARLREQVRGLTEAGEVVLTVHDVVGDDAEGAFEEALAELRAAVNRRSEGD